MSVLDGPGEGTWSAFALQVVEQRDALAQELTELRAGASRIAQELTELRDSLVVKETTKMLTLDEIRKRLQDRRLDVVALATGLHANSIARIRDAANLDPKYSTIHALSTYLEAQQ